MEALGAELVRELDRVARALDVRAAVGLLVGGHVVDGREVEEVVDALELLCGPRRRRRAAAPSRSPMTGTMRPVLGAPARHQLLEPRARALAHQHVDGALPLEQPLDQMPPDEAGGPGDEVLHRLLPSTPLLTQRARPVTRATVAHSSTRTPSRARRGSRRSRSWIVSRTRSESSKTSARSSAASGP